jgi:hypothetical protein
LDYPSFGFENPSLNVGKVLAARARMGGALSMADIPEGKELLASFPNIARRRLKLTAHEGVMRAGARPAA